MECRPFADMSLSVLMLGTVQFGLSYGIANRTGQPSYETVRSIIALGHEHGVNGLDTAAVYGSSEEVIGKALAELGIADRMVVATKITQMADEGVSRQDADAIVESSVARSLRNLRVERIPICLFHRERDFLLYAESLLRLRDKGMVGHVGSSVNTPATALEIVRSGLAEAVQKPSSVLDGRFIRLGIPGQVAARGVALFARSIYLQGLLLMRE